ncbi:uncharacterized protein LOC134706807 isoform X1 [Mytilus trossulus]|uniref:uncharacterized protein LOC134706807 isoform X1 n=1 Tax=Mytilus trossulus TaxID=6551 RepID=UPI003003AA15
MMFNHRNPVTVGFIFLILHIILFCDRSDSLIQYYPQKKTWWDAAYFCYLKDGSLMANDGLNTSIKDMPIDPSEELEFWTRNKVYSEWITIFGCLRLDKLFPSKYKLLTPDDKDYVMTCYLHCYKGFDMHTFFTVKGSYCACIDTKFLSEKVDLIDYRQNCDKLCKDGIGICGDFIENAEFVTVYRTITSGFNNYTQLNNYYLSLGGLERECLALDCANGRAQIRPCDEENDVVCSDGISELIVCDDATIHCIGDETIKIDHATFGRNQKSECFDDEYTSTCSTDSPTDILSVNCDDKTDCSVKSSVELFGDPCNGLDKDLRIKYHCEGTSFFSKSWIDSVLKCHRNGHSLRLNCRHGSDDSLYWVEAFRGIVPTSDFKNLPGLEIAKAAKCKINKPNDATPYSCEVTNEYTELPFTCFFEGKGSKKMGSDESSSSTGIVIAVVIVVIIIAILVAVLFYCKRKKSLSSDSVNNNSVYMVPQHIRKTENVYSSPENIYHQYDDIIDSRKALTEANQPHETDSNASPNIYLSLCGSRDDVHEQSSISYEDSANDKNKNYDRALPQLPDETQN